MRARMIAFLAICPLLTATSVASQSIDELRSKGIKAGLQESPGPIPVFYVAATKERALAFQRSLQDAFAWYQKQLNIDVPTALFVLDDPMRSVLGVAAGSRSAPRVRPALIFMDEGRSLSAGPIPGADPLHDVGGLLVMEGVLFHEAGHVFAHALKLPADSTSFVSELIANVFGVAYMRAERRDLDFALVNIRSGWGGGSVPRYTTWADFEYLGSTASMIFPYLRPDRTWFQAQLQRLADGMLNDESFPVIVERFRKELAAGESTAMSPEYVRALLKRVSPKFEPPATLFGPTTITRAAPTPCEASKRAPGVATSLLVIRNDRVDPISVTPVGSNSAPMTIQPGAWVQLPGVGMTYRLPDGSCVTVRDEPTIAIVSN